MEDVIVAKKCCRHCAYTKNHLGEPSKLSEIKSAISASPTLFKCHEHSDRVICANFHRLYPERFEGKKVVIKYEKGDKRSEFSHLTREDMLKFTYGGI